MLSVKLICVGKMREKFYKEAFEEYAMRLGPYCRFECIELPEIRLPDNPSDKEIALALDKEGDTVIKNLNKDSIIVVLCVEGRKLSSEALAKYISDAGNSGNSKVSFVIGGSYGLSPKVKELAALRLSMSDMTFPHHLARVMLAEQIYRSFKINEGSAYHK